MRQKGVGVLVCTTTVPSTASAFMCGQLRYLASEGWDVRLVSAPGPELDLVAEREGVTTYEIPMERELSPLSDFRSLLAWFVLLREIRPDVVSAGTPKAALLAMIASFMTGVSRRVYLVRGLRYEGESGFRAFVLKSVERLTQYLATDIVVVSESVYCALRRDRISTQPAFLIGQGSSNGVAPIDELDVARTGERVRSRLGIASSAFVAGFVGRPTADKGSETLFAAVQLLADSAVEVSVLVVGESISDKLVPETDCQIIGTGWVENAREYMCAMDVLVLPTRREGFPNVVLEAATVGTPTITTHATGAVDSVIDHVTGFLVPVGDAGQLADRILRFAIDSRLRLQFGEAARRRALNDFAPSRIWAGIDAIYRGNASEFKDIRVLGSPSDT